LAASPAAVGHETRPYEAPVARDGPVAGGAETASVINHAPTRPPA